MNRGLIALALVLSMATAGLSQEGKVIEPQYFSVFYCLRASGGAQELERQIPNMIPKGSQTIYVIPGEKSPVRFNAGAEIQCVVRVAEDFDEAAATMQLFRYEAKHGARRLQLENNRENKAVLKLNAERYGTSSLKLVPSQKLAPGEYCLSRSTIHQGYCFGVDAAGNQ